MAAYEKAITLDPNSPIPGTARATSCETEALRRGAGGLREGHHARPEFASPWNGKGNVLDEQKRYDEALAAYEKAITLDPEFVSPWNGKGNVLQNRSATTRRWRPTRRRSHSTPKSPLRGTARATSCGSQKRTTRHWRLYEKAIALDPEFAYPWNGKGNVLWGGRSATTRALDGYEKAIALDPEAYPERQGQHHNLKRYDETSQAAP